LGLNYIYARVHETTIKIWYLKQFKKCVTIVKYKIYLLVSVEIISCCITMNHNTNNGFTRKERREMIRPKTGVLEITRAYEMVRERGIPHMFGGGGF
jgi:hypothetical protein